MHWLLFLLPPLNVQAPQDWVSFLGKSLMNVDHQPSRISGFVGLTRVLSAPEYYCFKWHVDFVRLQWQYRAEHRQVHWAYDMTMLSWRQYYTTVLLFTSCGFDCVKYPNHSVGHNWVKLVQGLPGLVLWVQQSVSEEEKHLIARTAPLYMLLPRFLHYWLSKQIHDVNIKCCEQAYLPLGEALRIIK